MLNNLNPSGAQLANIPHEDDDLSDISENSDFHQGNGNGIGDPRKKTRILWTTEKEDYLLRCYNHYRLTSSSEHGLKGKSWRRIAFRMTNQFSEEYDSKSCRNKLNVLRYDYFSYKEIMEAKKNGMDNEAFWHQISEKYPRSSRWRDTDYPHADLMKKIFDQNGEGVEAIPESDGEQMLAKIQPKKRPRESYSGAVSPKNRRPSTGGVLRSDPPIEDILSRVIERVNQGFKDILEELRKSHEPVQDFRRQAMEELSKDRYVTILSDSNARDMLFEILKDHSIAKDFVYYPDNFKLNFLQDLIVKGRANLGNKH